MADEMNAAENNPQTPEIVFGALVIAGNNLDVVKTFDGKNCNVIFTVDGRTSVTGTVSIPLHSGNLNEIDSKIGLEGLTRKEIKDLIKTRGIQEVVKILRENKLTKEELLEGKEPNKEEKEK